MQPFDRSPWETRALPPEPVPPPPRRRWGGPLIALALGVNTLLAAAAGAFVATRVDDPSTPATGIFAPREVGGSPAAAPGDAAAVYARANPSVVQLQVAGANPRARGSGSGFVVDDDGLILTNYHVIEGTRTISVRFSTGEIRQGTVVGTDRANDIALLRVEGLPATARPLPLGDSSAVTVGETAIAIGSPFGLAQTVTQGIVSAVERTWQPSNGPVRQGLIQTDAPINPGNSGGPLLNARGEVIGINSLIESPIEGSVGIGFAVSINIAKALLPELQSGADLQPGYLGIQGTTLNEETAREYEVPLTSGVLITAVVGGAPAAAAGLRAGDVVRSIDGRQVTTMDALAALIRDKRPGAKVRLEVARGSGTITVEATLGEWPAGNP